MRGKLVEITLVLIGRSVEDERTFSIVKWVMDPQRNRFRAITLMRVYEFMAKHGLT